MQNSKESSECIQIVVFGYNRLDKIIARLAELREINTRNVHVSIDWFSEKLSEDFRQVLESAQLAWPKESKFSFFIHHSKNGMVRHITETVTRVLEEFDAIIVIEDDVPISEEFIYCATERLLNPEFATRYASVGGFSILKSPVSLRNFNYWRESPYFLCWGWGTRKEIWEHYRKVLPNENLEKSLQNSLTWNNLGVKQQETWLGRFKKIQSNPDHTWDIQFQYLAFKMSKMNLLPVGRVTENDGFGNLLSSHTRDRRPWWLGSLAVVNLPFSKSFSPKFIQNLLTWFESYTLIGDRKLHPALPWLIRRLKV